MTDILSDAARKSWQVPVRLSPAEERESNAHADAAVDRSDEDEDDDADQA